MSFSKILVSLCLLLGLTLLVLNLSKKNQEKKAVSPAIEAASAELCDAAVMSQSRHPSLKTENDETLPPDCDRISELFNTYAPLASIVQTVTYSGHVGWLTGRQAYIGDYATHYQTSKHFISRSLRGAGHFFSEAVSNGERFNVLRPDKEIEFHLVLDLSRLKMWVYCYDATDKELILLKTCRVCAGRLDEHRPSGSLTPTGVFQIGSEIAVYKEGMMGTFKNQPREIVTVFGKRWMPFEKEIADCTGPCRGLGLHGVPWKKDPKTGEYSEYRDCIGHYESGGCIRLLTEDIADLYAITVTKPTFVHIVKNFHEAKLPPVGSGLKK